MLQRVIRGYPDSSIAHIPRLSCRPLTSSARLLQSKKAKSYPTRGTLTTRNPISPAGSAHPAVEKTIAHGGSSSNFHKSLEILQNSLANEDAPNIEKHWKNIDAGSPPDPSRYNELSREIASLLKHNHIPEKLKSCLSVVEDIAIAAASHGFTRGLLAIMHTHLLSLDPSSVHRVYYRFRTETKRKSNNAEETETTSPEADLDIFTALPDPSSTISTHQLLDKPLPTKDKLQAEILFYAISACALRNDFPQVAQLVRRTPFILPGDQIRAFVNRLGPTFAPVEQIHTFLRRGLAANLVSRPHSLTRYLHQASVNRATLTVQAIYHEIRQGLIGNDPWLVTHTTSNPNKALLVLPHYVWSEFLYCFLRNANLQDAEKLWDDMISLKIHPDIGIWKAMMSGYKHLHMADKVTYAWDAMLQQGHIPDWKTYRLVIHSLLECGDSPGALTFLNEFIEKLDKGKLVADDSEVRSVFNGALRPLMHSGNPDKALALLERMETIGPTPDMTTLDIFLAYYSKRQFLKAFGDIMQKISKYGLVPTDFTYSAILTAMLPVREDAVSVVFEFMRKNGKRPNVAMYTPIIDALMNEQTEVAFKTALRLLQDMETSEWPEMRPNEVTYTCILAGLYRKNWMDRQTTMEYTALISSKMAKQRLLHSIVSYHVLIKACLENPEPEGVQDAMQYYREMKRRRITLMPDTWYILLSGLARKQEWDIADAMVEDLQKSNTVIPSSLARVVQRISERRSSNIRAR
jgi:pentatricopeptide repeat protein